MQAFKLTIKPETAFGTPLVGDTLFGQICWGIVEQFGETVLEQCLQDYVGQQPFLVVSDAFPSGHLPLPTLPSEYWLAGAESDVKKLKKHRWLPVESLSRPVGEWQQLAKTDRVLADGAELLNSYMQPHNSLSRASQTTKDGAFAPYESEQFWYADGVLWDIYLLLDTDRLSEAELKTVIANIGSSGYGRDASIGLGKFSVSEWTVSDLFEANRTGNALWTLASCCPQNQGFDAERSFYQVHTRFGRHGNVHAVLGRPFKKPVLMAKTGAVFTGVSEHDYIGQGVGGVSFSQRQAVHQGYAPVLRIVLDDLGMV